MNESTKEKVELQEKYCNLKEIPMFIPSDGRCYYCKRDITKAYTQKEIGSKQITGCPYCNKSFLD